MQFNTGTDATTIKVGEAVLDNICEFCYLGHTIYNDGRNSTALRIAKATAKFNELSDVLRDTDIHLSIRKKFLEASVRLRLAYATQAWKPLQEEIDKLEACWHGFLRRMVKCCFRNKHSEGDTVNFSFVCTNEDLLRLT